MKTNSRGFTFVEMLAAMAFMGILMPVVISALMLSNRAAVVSERTTVATQLGESKLNQMIVDDSWTSEGSRGDFGDQWPGYRWELAKDDWQSGSMTELSIDVFFQVQGSDHDVRLTTLVSDSQTQAQ